MFQLHGHDAQRQLLEYNVRPYSVECFPERGIQICLPREQKDGLRLVQACLGTGFKDVEEPQDFRQQAKDENQLARQITSGEMVAILFLNHSNHSLQFKQSWEDRIVLYKTKPTI